MLRCQGPSVRQHSHCGRFLSEVAIPEIRTRLTDTGLEVVARPPEEFLTQIKAATVSKGQLIRESGAKPDLTRAAAGWRDGR
jgi:hypothetical protein